MKELLAAVTAILASLGLYSTHQPTTDEAAIRSNVAAELVYASFVSPANDATPAPTPTPTPAKQATKVVPVAAPAPAKPAPKPPQPAAVWQRVWVRDGRFRGHWEWRLYYVNSSPQQRVQTYQRGSCTGGICR